MNKPSAYFSLFFKGVAMGAANVIPGVSGGTIAFITGIYEKLINSIKSFDFAAVKMLFSGNFKDFREHVNLYFLIAIFAGVGVAIVSLAKLLEYLFVEYEILTMAFFFGLILASVLLVGKMIKQWGVISVSMLAIGTFIAVCLGFLNPATENSSTFYVFVCGIVAVCSMILPGLSGSYILLIMGNYLLVLRAVSNFDIGILIPLLIGCVVGLVAFSHLLAFLFKKFHDGTVALLTGFVLGSLYIIWPWKETVYLKDESGSFITKDGGELIIESYQHYLPHLDSSLLFAFLLIIGGVLIVLMIDRLGASKPDPAV
ncbi:MAG: DUF368 domain-containing protein [Chitinophagales bacterium]|nr:DUF368 domain-containing protein [Chitinophagales bacterium]